MLTLAPFIKMKHLNATYHFYILSGLPGSGKTEYAKRMKNSYVIDFDAHCRVSRGGMPIAEYMPIAFKELKQKTENSNGNINVVLDGLFLTNKHINDAISIIKNFSTIFGDSKITVVKWNGDREACMHNDKLRGREVLAAGMILHGMFDNEVIIKNSINVDVEYQTVKMY